MRRLTVKDTVAAGLMLDLERELGHMAEVGDTLHALIARVAAEGSADPSFLVEGQKLDGLVQHIGEIADFCRRVAEQTGEMGFGRPAIAAAAAQVRLSTVGDRLSANGVQPGAPSLGECELW